MTDTTTTAAQDVLDTLTAYAWELAASAIKHPTPADVERAFWVVAAEALADDAVRPTVVEALAVAAATRAAR